MRKFIVLAAVASSIAMTGQAVAQACLGSPTRVNQAALGGNIGFLNNATAYTAALGYNPTGPITVGAEVGLTKIDGAAEDPVGVGGTFAWELNTTPFSACPVGRFRYDRQEVGGDEETTWTVPIGLGIGTSVPMSASGTGRLILNAVPQYQYIRFSDGPGDPDTSHEFGLDLGVTLHNSFLFGGAGVNITTVENSDPTFVVKFGLLLGQRRAGAGS